jgi:glycogen synthase
MRVLMTADAVGGVWTYALDLIEALPDDVEVVLAATGPPATIEQRARLREAAPARFEERPYALEWMDDPWADVERAGEWLLELAAEADVDLVHVNGYVHAALPFGRPVLLVGHSCVLSWHEAARGAPAGPGWSRYAVAVATGLRSADVVVAPTRSMLAALERIYAYSGEAFVIPNGRSRRGLEPGTKEPFVLGVGRVWDEAKNLAALERVAPELPWPVLVAGEGSSLGRLGELELQGLYGRASIFAEPARYEPFGLAALEAGLSGCALVLGDLASLREVWGDAAIYVSGSDDALLQALQWLIDDDVLRSELGARARGRALGYSPERMAEAYGGLYRRLAAGRSREAA